MKEQRDESFKRKEDCKAAVKECKNAAVSETEVRNFKVVLESETRPRSLWHVGPLRAFTVDP